MFFLRRNRALPKQKRGQNPSSAVQNTTTRDTAATVDHGQTRGTVPLNSGGAPPSSVLSPLEGTNKRPIYTIDNFTRVSDSFTETTEVRSSDLFFGETGLYAGGSTKRKRRKTRRKKSRSTHNRPEKIFTLKDFFPFKNRTVGGGYSARFLRRLNHCIKADKF